MNFSENVATNIGITFLKILDQEFPAGQLHEQYQTKHRRPQQVYASPQTSEDSSSSRVDGCNCRKPIECPLPNNCLTESLMYQATVNTSDKRLPKTYVGLTPGK